MRLAVYARVSTTEQSVEGQLAELRAYAERRGAEVVEYVDEGVSGRRDRRPALDAMLEAAHRRKIDAVAVVRLDRLARSLAHMARLGEDLQALGVQLISLRESIDTSTAAGRAMFGVCGVFAQLEADLIRERTLSGLEAARRRGARFGRPKAISPEQLKRLRRMHAAGQTQRHIAEVLGVGKSTVCREIQQLSAATA